MKFPLKHNILVSLLLLLSFHGNVMSNRPDTEIDELTPCPDRPNCVSSLETGNQHAIEPLRYDENSEHAFSRLKKIIKTMPRTQPVVETNDYLKIEFRTRFLRFVDIVEVKIDEAHHTIHIRSASTTGYWDFGVNRRRVEEIREKFRNGNDVIDKNL